MSIKGVLAGGTLMKECEQEIFDLKYKAPSQFVRDLFEVLKRGEKNEKNFCCVLIRQSFGLENVNKNIWEFLKDTDKNYVKSELLNNTLIQTDREVNKQVCYCIAELEIFLLTNGYEWEGLLGFLFGNLRACESIKSTVFYVFADICTFVHFEIFERKNEVVEACKVTIQSGDLLSFFSVLKFICKYLAVLSENEIEELSEVFGMCLDTLSRVNEGNEAEKLAKLLIELAESNPEAFKGKVAYVRSMIKSSENLEFLIVCFGIFTCLCPTLNDELLDNKGLIQEIFEEIFKFMIKTSILIESDWLNPEVETLGSEFDTTEIDYSKLGAYHISSIIQALGEEQTINSILTLIRSKFELNSHDWRINYACLLILSELGQFVDSQATLIGFLNLFPTLFESFNPKQKCAVFHCILKFSNDFGQEFTEKHFASLFPLLFNSLTDSTSKIVSDSLRSLKSFCCNSSHALKAYILPNLFPVILSLLSHENTTVMSSTLSLLSSLSDHQGERMIYNYSEILLRLDKIIKSSQSFSSFIRGKALETSAIICSQQANEGSKLFSLNLMQTMKSFQTSELEPNDPLIAFILGAWHRLAPIYPQEFYECISYILPNIFTVLHCTEDIINSEEGQIKVLALETLSIISKNLKQHFAPFMSQTIETVLPLLKSTKNSCIREKAAETLPFLLQSGKHAQVDLGGISKKLLFELWDSLLGEYDNKVKISQMSAIKSIIETVGEDFMSIGEVQASWDNLLGLIEFLYKDTNSSSLQVITEEVEDVYTAVSELIGIIFKTHKNMSIGLVSDVCSKVLSVFLNTDEPVIHKKLAVYIIDDMIEYLGEERVFDKWNLFAETIFIYSVDNDHRLRQAALYGLGLLAQFTSPNTFLQWKNKVLDILHQSINCLPLKQTKKFIHARENAISALGKLIKYQSVNFDLNNLIPEFLKLLPLKNDIEEGEKMNDLFGDLCLSYPHTVFGNSFERVGLVVEIIGTVIDSQICQQSTVKKIIKVLEYLWNECKEGLEVSINQLSCIQQYKIKSLMSI